MPYADLDEIHLANGWQAKEHCPDFKPVDASTFARVIEKVLPNVTETKRRTEGGIPLSAILVHLAEVFPLGPCSLLTTVTPNG